MKIALALALALIPLTAAAQSPLHRHGAPYDGFERREIKSLSAGDIAELGRGAGWGLALPAELNGHPGPLHVLELKSELALTAEQERSVRAIYERMRAEAVQEGERFIAAERALDRLFHSQRVDEAAVRAAIAKSEASRAKLRLIHLSAHLSTPALLTERQIARYNQLRGYAADPCTNVPVGHDPALWRRHNGCKE